MPKRGIGPREMEWLQTARHLVHGNGGTIQDGDVLGGFWWR